MFLSRLMDYLAELAALIEPACCIGSHAHFSRKLQQQIESAPLFLSAQISENYSHWIYGAYLITKVEKDNGTMKLRLADEDELVSLRRALSEVCGVGSQMGDGGQVPAWGDCGSLYALLRLQPGLDGKAKRISL